MNTRTTLPNHARNATIAIITGLALFFIFPRLIMWVLPQDFLNWIEWSAKGQYLVCILLQIIIVLLAIRAVPNFFVRIPTNHVVCVQVGEKIVHILGHKNDIDIIRTDMDAHPDLYKSSPLSSNQLIAREKHWLLGLLVWLFNLHFISIFPHASLRKVKVTRRRINPTSTNGDSLETMIVPSEGSTGEEESTPYLRFELPRPIEIRNLELRGQVLVHLVVYITRLRFTHLYEAFYGHSDISAWLDLQLTGALSRFCGQLSLDEFALADLTPNSDNDFNKFMRGDSSSNPLTSGLRAIGIEIIGCCSVVAYQLAGSEAAFTKARKEQEIAAIGIQTAASNAEAASIGTIKAGEAVARAIKARGEAEAEALKAMLKAKTDSAKELKEALGAPELAASVLQNEALASGSIQTFVSGSATPGIMIGGTGNGQPSTPPPTSTTPSNTGTGTKPAPAGKAPTSDTTTPDNTTGNGGNASPDDLPDDDGDDDDTSDDTSND
jgi:hypothetical protein